MTFSDFPRKTRIFTFCLGHAPQPTNGAAAQQAGGQGATQDYSAEWANYYRSMGKIDEAEAIEKQIASSKVSSGVSCDGLQFEMLNCLFREDKAQLNRKLATRIQVLKTWQLINNKPISSSNSTAVVIKVSSKLINSTLAGSPAVRKTRTKTGEPN